MTHTLLLLNGVVSLLHALIGGEAITSRGQLCSLSVLLRHLIFDLGHRLYHELWLVSHLAEDGDDLLDGGELQLLGVLARDALFDDKKQRLPDDVRVEVQDVVVVVVYHDHSLDPQGLLVTILKVKKLEVLARHDVLLLLDHMDRSINDFFHLDVFDVAVAGLVVSSFLNAALYDSPIATLLDYEIDLLGKLLMRGELCSV